MTPENKLGIISSDELAPEEEPLTKHRALELFDEENHLLAMESSPIRANEIKSVLKEAPSTRSTTAESA